ncbi:DUF5688 family protein [Porcincola intestinalis]|uniref:Uncharacterized protein n=1 Tax=Porcincola intestinalis TaxID=2606632 RepID=A0A6L5XBR4_9FIRM|nr:DUF5688 family protein [Porcincola intestinalis]MSS15932.1 hypothetical protein [Porcincola intestinalis]
MNYEQFLEQIKEDLTARFVTDLPPEYADVRIGIRDVEKLQGESYRGLSFRNGDSRVEVDLNLNPAFQAYEAGKPFQDLVKDVQMQIMEALDRTPKIDIDELSKYETIKPKLMMEIISQKGNEDKLQKIPHQKVEDLALIYRVDMGGSADGRMTSVVTNRQLEAFGITAEQLHQDALENAPITHPASLCSMREVMAEMTGTEPEEPAMLVATVEDGFMGASVIQYPGFMEQAAEQVGGDLFVLPSSIHEVLLIPDDGKADFHDLEAMVQSINEAQVAPEERLSDHVYHYDKTNRVFELAEKTAARNLAQEREKKAARDGAEKKPSVLAQLGERKKEATGHEPKAKTSERTAPEAAL